MTIDLAPPSVRIGNALEFAYGKSLPEKARRDGPVPVYGSNGIVGWHDNAIVPDRTIIVGRKGAAGVVHLTDGPSYPIDTTYYVRVRQGYQFDLRYLAYALRAKNLSRLRIVVAVPGINREDVYKEYISYPQLSEQLRVVEILARAENIVRMRREAEAKAKEIIPSLFLEMFSAPDLGCQEASSAVSLGEVADVVSGVAKGRKLDGKVTREVPYLRVANVQAGGLDLSEMKYIPATAGEIAELAVRSGDVLLTEGGDFDKVGRGALLETDIGECIHQNHVFRVRTHAHRVIPEYFAAYLQTSAARQYFLKAAKKTSNLASINMTQLRNLQLPLPRLETQRKFQDRFRDCRALEEQQSAATRIADISLQSLLAMMFSERHPT